MKRCSHLFLLIGLSALAFSYGGGHYIKLQGHDYSRVGDLYVAQCEVTNGEFNAFLNDLKGSAPEQYRRYYFDTAGWKAKYVFLNTAHLDSQYHRHPAFRDYPAVNISWEAANAYCVWLTAKYNSTVPAKRRMLFSLPTEKEWMMIAGHNAEGYPAGFVTGKDRDGYYHADVNTFHHGNYDTIAADGGYFMVRVDAYAPNPDHVFCLVGNVAEMTATKGIEKGGGWFTPVESCRVDSVQEINAPDPMVGFRVIARPFR